MILKTFAFKMAQTKARIWPWLACVFQIRSTAAYQSTFMLVPSWMEGSSNDEIFDQPSEGGQTVFFNCLDLHHKSPDSSERQYKSGT
jgi:hypothetical protein